MSAKTKQSGKSPKSKESAQASESKGPVFLDKDTEKQYPVQEHDLDSVIVYQYVERKVLEQTVKLPASHINAIGIYTPEEFEEHTQEGGLFDRLGLKYEVWHEPTPVSEDEGGSDPNND